MMRIPLQAVPNQTLSVVLDDQNCTITVRQIGDRLYLSLVSDLQDVCNAHIVQNRVSMPSWSTTRFLGRLVFVDAEGTAHPSYDGLGTRFFLYYLTEDEWQALRTA